MATAGRTVACVPTGIGATLGALAGLAHAAGLAGTATLAQMPTRDPRRLSDAPGRDHSLDIANDGDSGPIVFRLPSLDIPPHPDGIADLWIAVGLALWVAYRAVRVVLSRRPRRP